MGANQSSATSDSGSAQNTLEFKCLAQGGFGCIVKNPLSDSDKTIISSITLYGIENQQSNTNNPIVIKEITLSSITPELFTKLKNISALKVYLKGNEMGPTRIPEMQKELQSALIAQNMLHHTSLSSISHPDELEISKKFDFYGAYITFSNNVTIIQKPQNKIQTKTMTVLFQHMCQGDLSSAANKKTLFGLLSTPSAKQTKPFIYEGIKSIIADVEKLHHNGFFHRDIKPENILICDNDNKLMLIDFGFLASKDSFEDPKKLCQGTHQYMLPKLQKACKSDNKSDKDFSTLNPKGTYEKTLMENDKYALAQTIQFILKNVTLANEQKKDLKIIKNKLLNNDMSGGTASLKRTKEVAKLGKITRVVYKTKSGKKYVKYKKQYVMLVDLKKKLASKRTT